MGDAALAKEASDTLLSEHGIYVQSINYPTVKVGEERLRITPTPGHTTEQMKHLVDSIEAVFNKLKLKRVADWEKVGGRAGVGIPFAAAQAPSPVWTDAQLGLVDGSAPVTLGEGRKAVVQDEAAREAMGRLREYLNVAPILSEGEGEATSIL